jgi:TonB-linked SusC/RagA family outer membrane protein
MITALLLSWLPGVAVQADVITQQRRITGRVTDSSSGEPLPGVNVTVKGTTLGVVTGLDGEYAIQVPDDAALLSFSFIGYVTQEVETGTRTVIDVPLVEDVMSLDEVTVTALGISREKKALGYSVGEVKSDALTRVTQENVLNALSAKVSGAQIQNTGGDPGSSVSIVIRGAKSLGNDNQPLFVIDGIPVSNSLNNVDRLGTTPVDYGNAINDLNPNDIESVSVLKGPSAAALYGSRAGNGVVMITTKSGDRGRKGIGVTVDMGVVFDQPYKFHPEQYRFTSGLTPLTLGENEDIFFGPEMNVGMMAKQWAYGGHYAPLVAHPDKWQDFLDKPGFTLDNNIGIAGNFDKGSFRMSYGNMYNEGVIPNTDMKRNSFSVAPVYKLTSSLTVSANINISQSKSDNRPSGGGDNNNPSTLYALTYLPPHIDINRLKDYWLVEGLQQNSYSANRNNPYFLAYEMTNAYVRDRLFGNAKADWQILPHLSLMGRFAMDSYTEKRESRVPFSYTGAVNGSFAVNDVHHLEMNADFLLSYDTSFNDFQLNLSGGGNLMQANGSSIYAKASQLVVPNLYTLSNALGGLSSYGNGFSRKIIYSLYGMATVSYRNFAYLDLTARNDWSSTLPANNRSYFYPSVSLSLLVNEIIGIPTSENMYKLRAGWAQVGNDTSPYSLYPSIGVNGNDWGAVKRAYLPSNILNPNLKPEIATSKEFGFDIQAFRNRVGLGMTYYVSDNRNQILDVADMAPSSGYTSKKINAGLVQSSGWEIELRTVPVETNDLKWNLDFTFTRNRTKIKELTAGMDFITLYDTDGGYARTYVGEYIGDIWGNDYERVTDPSSPYYNWPLLYGNMSNGYIYNFRRTDDTMVKIGNFNHDFLMGISTTVQYKSFVLSALFDWRQGGDFFSGTQRRLVNLGHVWEALQGVPYQDAATLPEEIKANPDRYFGQWIGGQSEDLGGLVLPASSIYASMGLGHSGAFVPGVYLDDNGNYVEHLGNPETTSIVPTGFITGQDAMWHNSARYIYDASFLKLREISLSYRLPEKWTEPLSIRRLGISVFCRNLMLWTANNISVDPESAFNISSSRFQQGMEKYNMMPWTLSFGTKLNIEF